MIGRRPSDSAPVIIEGAPGALARLRDLDPYAAYDPGPRTGLVVFVALLEAGAVALLLLLVSLWQASSEPVARTAHERGLAALLEVDALIALHTPDLQRQLDEATDASTPLTLPDFPVRDVRVPAGFARDASGGLDATHVRVALLEASGARVYERGSRALGPPELEPATAPGFPAAGLIEGMLDNLTRYRHSQAAVLLVPALAVVGVLGLLLLVAGGRARWLSLGLPAAASGVLVLALVLGARLLLGTPEAATPSDVYARLARTLLALPTWNAAITLGLGAALTLVGWVGMRGE